VFRGDENHIMTPARMLKAGTRAVRVGRAEQSRENQCERTLYTALDRGTHAVLRQRGNSAESRRLPALRSRTSAGVFTYHNNLSRDGTNTRSTR